MQTFTCLTKTDPHAGAGRELEPEQRGSPRAEAKLKSSYREPESDRRKSPIAGRCAASSRAIRQAFPMGEERSVRFVDDRQAQVLSPLGSDRNFSP